MSDDSDDSTTVTTEKTFTRAEVRRMIAAEVSKVSDRYADYDDLKAKATAAAGEASKIDKLTTAVEALTTRAEKAENANMRREIADEFGLTAREAKRLNGKSADELREDAEAFVEDMGIDVKARRASKAATVVPKGEATDGETGVEGGDGAADTDDASSRQTAPARTARPRENLASGAARTPAAAEETNPLKLVEGIPRR